MGNEYIFDEDDNSIEIDLKNVTWNVDMHGYPVYEDVVKVQNDLQEEQLRNTHPELQQAYEEYQRLLEKYKFWDKFESK
jgi:hypothetical protein